MAPLYLDLTRYAVQHSAGQFLSHQTGFYYQGSYIIIRQRVSVVMRCRPGRVGSPGQVQVGGTNRRVCLLSFAWGVGYAALVHTTAWRHVYSPFGFGMPMKGLSFLISTLLSPLLPFFMRRIQGQVSRISGSIWTTWIWIGPGLVSFFLPNSFSPPWMNWTASLPVQNSKPWVA
jgi:hypothetical protein